MDVFEILVFNNLMLFSFLGITIMNDNSSSEKFMRIKSKCSLNPSLEQRTTKYATKKRYQAAELFRTLWTLIRIIGIFFFTIWVLFFVYLFIFLKIEQFIEVANRNYATCIFIFPNNIFARTGVSFTCGSLYSVLNLWRVHRLRCWHLYLEATGILQSVVELP